MMGLEKGAGERARGELWEWWDRVGVGEEITCPQSLLGSGAPSFDPDQEVEQVRCGCVDMARGRAWGLGLGLRPLALCSRQDSSSREACSGLEHLSTSPRLWGCLHRPYCGGEESPGSAKFHDLGQVIHFPGLFPPVKWSRRQDLLKRAAGGWN